MQQIWIWSEFVVLLFNRRKRAIHDFIAGTVVILKEFAEPDLGLNVPARGMENSYESED